jgi:hypothetical protein
MTTMNKQDLAENYGVQVSSIAPQADSADAAALSVGNRFLVTLAARDFEQMEDCFQADVSFRALVPSGVREGIGPQVTVAWLRRWFEGADLFDIQRKNVDIVADRLHISYRIRLSKEGLLQMIEQQAYCEVKDGRVIVMNLLCSGFRPLTASLESEMQRLADIKDAWATTA